MSRKVLEIPYLVNVSINFINISDIRTFILINHKCEEVIKCLKINPSFINQPSLKWFVKHFTPDTIDLRYLQFGEIEFLQEIPFIRNPSFLSFKSKGLLNDEFKDKIIPKIKRMRFYGNPLDGVEITQKEKDMIEINNYIVLNSKCFGSLDYIEGDIEIVAQFLESYTDNGNEIYIKMPKRIVITTMKGYAIELNQTTVQLIKRIEKCLPNNNTINVSIIIYTHPSNEMYFDSFRRINYYYRCINYGMCEKYSDHLFTENGKLWIDGIMTNNKLNNVIENSNAMVVYYRYITEREDEYWNVPQCVETIIFQEHYCYGNDRTAKVFMKYIKYLIVDTCDFIKFKKNEFELLKELKIQKCSSITFSKNQFKSLEILSVDSSANVKFTETCELNLKQLKLMSSDVVNINSSLNEIKELTIVQCKNVNLIIESFENKKIYIEECNYMKFGKEGDINPMKYSGIDEIGLKNMIENVLELPLPHSCDCKTNQKVFKMRKFIPKSNSIEANGNVLKRIVEIDQIKGDMVVSNSFYTETNKDEVFMFMGPNNEISYLKDIRYFEIKVTGVSIVSVGCIDKDNFSSFFGRHVGWDKGSIGYHSDDGFIYNESSHKSNGEIETNFPYGIEVGLTNVVGVGYNSKTQEVFFTFNGNLIVKVKVPWENISAAIGFYFFNPVVINYGSEPFLFDLLTIS